MDMRRITGTLLAGILAVVAMPAWSQQSTPSRPSAPVSGPVATYNLDIPRTALKGALLEFCHQTGLLYGQMPETPADETRLVGPLKGTFTADAALAQLLSGTGLTFEWTRPTQFSVGRPSLAKLPNGAGVDGEPKPGTEQPRSTLRNRRPVAVVPATGRGGSSAHGPADERRIENVTVTGSRIEQSASGEGPTPVTLFTSEEIRRFGVSSVGDLIKYVSQQPYTRTEGFRISGAQYAEMRGIGVDTTSILINGRRVVPSASSLANNAFDLNTIPLVAVERVEVLSDSASAVYGADAIGGVVNIILKDDIPEPILALNYGAARGGADEQRLSLSAGYSTERLKAVAILDYSDRSFLLGSERDRWSNQDFRRFGGADLRSPNANPGNITALFPVNLPGLPSRFAAVPNESSGVGLVPLDFLATAGTRNLDSLYRYFTVVPEAVRHNIVGSVDLSLIPSVVATGELLYVNQKSSYQVDPPSLINAIVPATNAFNPFGVPVAANLLLDSVGPREFNIDSELLRIVAALRGPLGRWKWDLSFLRMAEESTILTSNMIDPVRVNAALASRDPLLALNVFQDGPGGSPALLRSLIATPTQNRNSSEGVQGAGFLRGPLLDGPTGTIDAVIGGEWRREKVIFDENALTSHHRLISAAFAEARVPLINPRAALPALRELSFTIAARLDDYDDFGSTFNPRYGLVWQPHLDLTLRASYGTSFRPPSMLELFAPRVLTPGPIIDPRRNNQPVSPQVLTGGNPELGPIEANSLTAGFVLTPPMLDKLRLAANYWQVHMRNRITIVPLNSLLANEASFPGRVVRNMPTPADVAAGLPGTLAFLDLSRVNLGRLRTSGIDVDASVGFDTDVGRFTSSLSATWVREFRAQDLPSLAYTERVGVASFLGSIARWRAIGSLGWERGGLSLSATARYVPAYADANALIGRNGRTIPSQTIFDAQVSLDLEEAFDWHWDGMEMTVGMHNILDEEPNFAEIGSVLGFDTSQGDLKQRYGYINVSKRF